MVKAIVFDLWETLVTEFDPNWKADDPIGMRLGISEQEFLEAWRSIHDMRMRGEIADYPTALKLICSKYNVGADREIIERLYHERVRQKSRPMLEIDSWILQMLTEIRERGLKLGLLSNAAQEEVLAWPDSPLAGFFDATVFSFEAGTMKPDIAIFCMTCDKLGVATADACFAGDGGSSELIGARDAGLMPIHTTWYSKFWPHRQAPSFTQQIPAGTLTASNPAELLEILDQRNV